MALFISDLAFHDALIDAAKLGILSASVVSAAAGLAVLAWSTTGKRGDGNGEARFAAITRADGTTRLELSDGEGKSRFEVATLADGTAAPALGEPEEKRRSGVIAKANGFARLSTPLHREAPSRENQDRAA